MTDLFCLVNCTLTLPLNQDWSPTTIQFGAITKPAMPPYNFQSLFYDDMTHQVNTFGGELSSLTSEAPKKSIWSMSVDGKGEATWTKNSTSNDPPFSQGIARTFGGALAASSSSALYLGGYASSNTSLETRDLTSFVPTPGVVRFDYRTNAWSNDTSTKPLSLSGTFMWGAMEPVPFRPNGLIAVFGGDTSNKSTYVPGQDQNPMDVVNLFDPVTKIWDKQNTTGTPPSSRSQFCSTGVGDSRPVVGNSSTGTYEIVIYGGYAGSSGPATTQFDELWILTLPQFRWIQASGGYAGTRIGHTCHVVGGNQFLTIEGWIQF